MSEMGSTVLDNGINTKWIGTVNFNLRKPIIIHHTAQDSLQQTIKTFTVTRTQVSSHVIADDGSVQMLNDYLRAWHAGRGSWGKDTDINSSSIGIELDNNGTEVFLKHKFSLMALLSKLKKEYNIPTQNIYRSFRHRS
jgi:N-acetylmuramoyl-L-alanine amidase